MAEPIGLFGGTFDPIHYGHLRTAFELLQALKLAQVRFLPTGNPPHREEPLAASELRLEMVRAAVAGWTVAPRVVVDPAEKWLAFRRARAALAASGTVTLELALAGIPTVAAYRMSPIEAFIVVWLLRLLVRLPSVILANLVLGENVIPELLQSAATPQRLAEALLPLLSDTPQRQRQIEAFGRLDAIMAIGGEAPSAKAAAIVLDVAQQGRRDPAALSASSQPC